jgi:hypothetical protein
MAIDAYRLDCFALLFIPPQVPVTVGLEKTIQYFRKELEESGESKLPRIAIDSMMMMMPMSC